MHLLIVRHAIAEQIAPDSEAVDAERRLTKKGARRMRRGAAGLRRLVPELDVVLTSPLVRAVETAEIVSEAFDDLEVIQTPVLAPGTSPEEFAAWFAAQQLGETVALVGHEPGLSTLASWLVCGGSRSVIELKKGAACLLDCAEGPAAGGATLLWSLRPGHLRRLRR